MGFWIFIGIAIAMVMVDEIMERKVRGYTKKKYSFCKAVGAVPRSSR